MTIQLRTPIRIIAVLCIACAICLARYASAYQTEMIPGGEKPVGDFVVGPTKLEIRLEPGTEQTVELLVTNRMGERRKFHLDVEDATGSSDPSQSVVLLGNDRGPYSLKDYIHFPEADFELAQGERARIPVTVSIPENAQPGGLYGSVLVTTTSLPKDGEELGEGTKSGSVIISRIGALFFVTIPGAVEKEGKLHSFSTVPEGKRVFDMSPINFQILFENTGSVHVNPSGEIRIMNILGEEVDSVEISPWYAMPKSMRLREIAWNRDYLFGRYTAELDLKRGYGEEMDHASVTFYVLPWRVILAAFGVLVVIFFILRFIFSTFQIRRK